MAFKKRQGRIAHLLKTFGDTKARYDDNYLRREKMRYPNNSRVARTYPRSPHYAFARQGKYAQTITNFTLDVGTLHYSQIGTNIGKGTNRGDRIGDRIRLTSLSIKAHIHNPATTSPGLARIRWMVLINKRPNSTVHENFFGSITDSNAPVNYNALGDTAQLISPINRDKFTVLYDQLKDLPLVTNHDAHPKDVLWKMYVPIKNILRYNDEAAGVDRIWPNVIVAYFIEGDANVSTAAPVKSISYTIETNFINL